MIHSSYFDLISHPMDLSTINAKVENGNYASREEMRDDFNLMIHNAKTYNPPGFPVHSEAEGLENVFAKSGSFDIVSYLLC